MHSMSATHGQAANAPAATSPSPPGSLKLSSAWILGAQYTKGELAKLMRPAPRSASRGGKAYRVSRSAKSVSSKVGTSSSRSSRSVDDYGLTASALSCGSVLTIPSSHQWRGMHGNSVRLAPPDAEVHPIIAAARAAAAAVASEEARCAVAEKHLQMPEAEVGVTDLSDPLGREGAVTEEVNQAGEEVQSEKDQLALPRASAEGKALPGSGAPSKRERARVVLSGESSASLPHLDVSSRLTTPPIRKACHSGTSKDANDVIGPFLGATTGEKHHAQPQEAPVELLSGGVIFVDVADHRSHPEKVGESGSVSNLTLVSNGGRSASRTHPQYENSSSEWRRRHSVTRSSARQMRQSLLDTLQCRLSVHTPADSLRAAPVGEAPDSQPPCADAVRADGARVHSVVSHWSSVHSSRRQSRIRPMKSAERTLNHIDQMDREIQSWDDEITQLRAHCGMHRKELRSTIRSNRVLYMSDVRKGALSASAALHEAESREMLDVWRKERELSSASPSSTVHSAMAATAPVLRTDHPPQESLALATSTMNSAPTAGNGFPVLPLPIAVSLSRSRHSASGGHPRFSETASPAPSVVAADGAVRTGRERRRRRSMKPARLLHRPSAAAAELASKQATRVDQESFFRELHNFCKSLPLQPIAPFTQPLMRPVFIAPTPFLNKSKLRGFNDMLLRVKSRSRADTPTRNTQGNQ